VPGTFGPAHSRFADGTFLMLPRSALANPPSNPRADRGNSSSAPLKVLTFDHRDALDGSLWAKYRAQNTAQGTPSQPFRDRRPIRMIQCKQPLGS
jgi:hypothetical protein